MASTVSQTWSQRRIKTVVRDEIRRSHDRFGTSERVRCFIAVLMNYASGLLAGILTHAPGISLEKWTVALDDIRTWNDTMLSKEVTELVDEYPDMEAMYEQSTRKFIQHIHRGDRKLIKTIVLFPLTTFIHKFLQYLLRRHDVKNQVFLSYNIADRKDVIFDTIRLSLMRLYSSVSQSAVSTIPQAIPRPIVPSDSVSTFNAPAPKPDPKPPSVVDSLLPSSRLASVVGTKLTELHAAVDQPAHKDTESHVSTHISKFRRAPRSKVPCFWPEGAPPSFSGSCVNSVRGDRPTNVTV